MEFCCICDQEVNRGKKDVSIDLIWLGKLLANTFPQVISNSLLGSVWSYSYLKKLDSSAGGNYNGYEMY